MCRRMLSRVLGRTRPPTPSNPTFRTWQCGQSRMISATWTSKAGIVAVSGARTPARRARSWTRLLGLPTGSAPRHRVPRSPQRNSAPPSGWVFQFPANITSVVDAPRLVSSDGRPTRPECAVTRHSTPAACAAAVNLNPIVCADNGTTRPAGSGFVTARSVRMARATPAFTNRPSFVSPSWFVLLLRTVTSTPSPSGGVDHVGPAQRAHLAAPHPRHETAIQRSPHRDGRARRPSSPGRTPASTSRPNSWPTSRRSDGNTST